MSERPALAYELVIISRLQVRAGAEDEVIAALRANAEATHEEPGVVRFAAHRELGDPRRIVMVEAYRTAADFDRHRETPHYKACLEILPGLLDGAPDTVRFSPLPFGIANGKGTLS